MAKMGKLRQGSLLSLRAKEASPAQAGRGQQTPHGTLVGSCHPGVRSEHPSRLPWKSPLPEPTLSFGYFASPNHKAGGAQRVAALVPLATCGLTTALEATWRYERKWGSIQKGGTSKHRPGREQHLGRSCLGRAGQSWLPLGTGRCEGGYCLRMSWAKSAPNGEALEASC